MEQLFIAAADGIQGDDFERQLYMIRKRSTHALRGDENLEQSKMFYICSLSCRSIIYKGMMLAEQVAEFYPDLKDERFVSAFAIYHQRYSTNTFPQWWLAQPFRMLAHNGEINTLKGNVNWMKSHEIRMASAAFGDMAEDIKPIIAHGSSDSAALDAVFEVLVRAGILPARFLEDENGNPIGSLQEGAVELILPFVPEPTAEERVAGIVAGQEYLLALGVTAWQDAMVEPATHEAYVTLDGRGGLVADVIGCLWWERSQGAEQVAELAARRDASPPGRYRPTSVKMMLDGVAENHTASMLEPYLDESGNPTSNRGIDFIDPDDLRRYVTMLDAAGLQVQFHALVDRAVRQGLDALEAAYIEVGDRWSKFPSAKVHVTVMFTSVASEKPSMSFIFSSILTRLCTWAALAACVEKRSMKRCSLASIAC